MYCKWKICIEAAWRENVEFKINIYETITGLFVHEMYMDFL